MRLLRKIGWIGAFGALAKRAYVGLNRLDEPLPKDQLAEWPPLGFTTRS